MEKIYRITLQEFGLKDGVMTEISDSIRVEKRISKYEINTTLLGENWIKLETVKNLCRQLIEYIRTKK
jgi:hypothetical protein